MSARKQTVSVVTITTFGLDREIATPVTRKGSPILWNLWHYRYPKMIAILLALAKARPDLGEFRIAIDINSQDIFEVTLQFKVTDTTNNDSEEWMSILSITTIIDLFSFGKSKIFTIECYKDRSCPDWRKKKVSISDLSWVNNKLILIITESITSELPRKRLLAMAATMSIFYTSQETCFISIQELRDILYDFRKGN